MRVLAQSLRLSVKWVRLPLPLSMYSLFVDTIRKIQILIPGHVVCERILTGRSSIRDQNILSVYPGDAYFAMVSFQSRRICGRGRCHPLFPKKEHYYVSIMAGRESDT